VERLQQAQKLRETTTTTQLGAASSPLVQQQQQPSQKDVAATVPTVEVGVAESQQPSAPLAPQPWQQPQGVSSDVTASMAALSLKTVLGIETSTTVSTTAVNATTTTSPMAPIPTTTTTESSAPTEGAAFADVNTSHTLLPATAASVATASAVAPTSAVLDKKSLQLTLLSLLQDDRFLDLVHSQYLKVVRARAAKQQQQQQVQQSVAPHPDDSRSNGGTAL
jgi:hypothetical protein